MHFHVLSLFPDAFKNTLEYSMLSRALDRRLVSIDITDIRDYSHDPHRTADDYQFGGGHGMVLKPGPVFEATEAALSGYSDSERANIPIILFTPQGEILTQEIACHGTHRRHVAPGTRSHRFDEKRCRGLDFLRVIAAPSVYTARSIPRNESSRGTPLRPSH